MMQIEKDSEEPGRAACIRRYIIRQAIKRTLVVGGTVLSVGAASIGTMGLAHAATSTSTTGSTSSSSSTTNPQQSLIDKLVAKFNLNKDDVQKVFDEDHATHEAEQQAKVKTELNQLVTDGKITQDQEDKIIAKAAELKTTRDADRDAMKDKTDAERKAALDAQRSELDTWLSDNGIAAEYGRYLMGHGGHGGSGGSPPSDQSTQ